MFWKEKKGFTQMVAEERGSRRLPQIRAQMNADFLEGVKLKVPYVLIPQIRDVFAFG